MLGLFYVDSVLLDIWSCVSWLLLMRDPSLLKGRRPYGFLGLSLNDGTILFLVILLV